MTYKEWKETLTDAHWDKIGEAILDDEEETNIWADDHEHLFDVVKHFGGTEDFAYTILDEWNNEED